jgi:hypothetical protein
MSARAERSGLGFLFDLAAAPLPRVLAAGQPRDPAALLAAMRSRSVPHPVPGFERSGETASIVAERWPNEAAALLDRAERIVAGSFDLMGHPGLSFGSPIDWQLDPVAGLRARLRHWSRVPYLDPTVVGDHKVVWELNRHQWLVTLGQTYALTGDERWARHIAQSIDAWLDANPPKLGINWASSLEVSFRAISWLSALQFVRTSPWLTPALYARMLESLHVHGRHLETYLSTYFSPNTHLTGEALGLFYLGVFLPELHSAPRWQRHGLAVLQSQLPIHVHPDGVYFEQATQYHRYTTDFYLHLVLLADANGIALEEHVRPTLERLFEHLLYLSRPDGTIPLFGDDDGGRLMQLDGRKPDDVRALLAAGAVMFNREDFAYGARGDLAGMVWLLGLDGLRRFESLQPAPPAELARGFPDGGYYVGRDSWEDRADWLAFDCGPHGIMNAGHAHADALSVEVVVQARPVFIDPGTYTYSGPERNAFREARAHSTVTIDGVSSSVPSPAPFRWASTANVSVERWHAGSRGFFVQGSHDGYASLDDPAIHRRTVLHVAGDYWIVRDRIESAGRHEVDVRFHCAPGLDPVVSAGASRAAVIDVLDPGHRLPVLHLRIFGGPGTATVEDGWVSRQYGSRERSRVIVWRQDGTGDQEVVSFLLPHHSVGDVDVRESTQVAGGRCFIIAVRGATDSLLVGDGGPLSAEGVETDAAWLWLRRDSAGRVVDYFAVDASYGRVGEDDLWTPADRVDWRALARSEAAQPV